MSYRDNKLNGLFPVVGAALLLIFATSSARAADNPALGIGEPTTQPDPPDDPPECQHPPCDDCNGSSSPVYVATGTYYRTLVDADFNFERTLPFSLSRTYNSDDFYIGYFGRGWHSSLDMMSIPTIKELAAGEVVVIRWPDGKRGTYLQQPDDSYSQPLGRSRTLEKVPGGFELTTLEGTIYTFDEQTHLLSISDRDGFAVTFGYDVDGRVSTATLPGGRDLTVTYHPNGLISTVADWNGLTHSYAYDADGFLTSYTDPLDNLYRYEYDDGLLARMFNPSGQMTLSVTYDTQGRVSRIIDEEGDFTYTYPSASQTRRTDNETGAVWIYNTDGQGVVTTSSGPAGLTRQQVFDAAYNLVTFKPLHGTATTYTYDDKGRVLTESDPLNNTTSYTYTPLDKVETVVDPLNRVTTFEYDSAGNLTRVIDPEGNGDTNAYYANGRVASVTDENGHSRTFTYDASGHPLTRTDELMNTTTYVHDEYGRLVSITNPMNMITSYEYDALGRRTKVIDNIGEETIFTYEGGSDQRVTAIIDPNDNTTTYEYDAFDNVTRTIDPLLNVTTTGYDSHGLITSETNKNMQTILYGYDLAGHRTRITEPGGGQTTYAYGSIGQLTVLTDARGNARTFAYDNAGRLTQVVTPDTGTTTYGYDAASQLTLRTDAGGNAAAFGYDDAGRLTSMNYADSGLNVVMRYDEPAVSNGQDRLTSMTDPSGDTEFHYNAAGDMTRVDSTRLGVDYTLGIAVMPGGAPAAITYPSGMVVTYTYGPVVPRAATITANFDSTDHPLVTNVTHDGNANRTGVTYGNGTQDVRTYDALNRVSTVTVAGVHDLAYSADPVGNVQSITDALDSGRNRTYGYDIGDRLTAATGPWGSNGYAYDATGNRTQHVDSAGTNTYAYTGNRLTGITGPDAATFSYDAVGNITSDGTFDYVYGANGRLLQVMQAETVVATYTYDATGQRAIKDVGGTATVYHYDHAGNLIAETAADGTTLVEYVYMPDSTPVAMIQGGNIYYYHCDHLRTPLKMTDATGTVVWEAELLPFGDTLSESGSITQNLRLPGQYLDRETGLLYNRQRTYHPGIGRYLEHDPAQDFDPALPSLLERFLSSPQELNGYVYALNNPVTNMDPDGLVCGSGWSDYVVPDSWYGIYDFTPCCQDHDDCYGKCGMSKASCDNNFLSCMRNQCKKISAGIFTGYWKFCCRFTAKTYYHAVDKLGGGAYDNAQKDCCSKC